MIPDAEWISVRSHHPCTAVAADSANPLPAMGTDDHRIKIRTARYQASAARRFTSMLPAYQASSR